MATEDQVEMVKELCHLITKTEIEQLVYNKDWGSINFEAAKPDLERLFSICNHFQVLPIDLLPKEVANLIVREAEPINATLESVRGFTIEQDNPSNVRDNYLEQITSNTDKLYLATHLYIPYLAYQRGEIQENIKQLTTSVRDAKKLLDETETDMNKQKKTIGGIVSAAREASASVGVGHFTADFDGEATGLEELAENWLKGTGALALASLVAGTYFLFSDPNLTSAASAIQYVSSKILILVLLITGTLWCGNIYKATKHQAAVNKFKANSLKTFQAFVNAAEDDTVKDAVLIEATRAIFSESATGYINSDGAGANQSTRIVEVVKNGAQATSAASRTVE